MLNVAIRNTGIFNPNGINKDGYGIPNTKQRLKIIFKNKAEFKIQNESENMVLTLVRIPTE